jgi:hypothetical protein
MFRVRKEASDITWKNDEKEIIGGTTEPVNGDIFQFSVILSFIANSFRKYLNFIQGERKRRGLENSA